MKSRYKKIGYHGALDVPIDRSKVCEMMMSPQTASVIVALCAGADDQLLPPWFGGTWLVQRLCLPVASHHISQSQSNSNVMNPKLDLVGYEICCMGHNLFKRRISRLKENIL